MADVYNINTTTEDAIRGIAQKCVERAEAIVKKMHSQGAGENHMSQALNSMALDYFIGAAALASTLKLEGLLGHLTHVIITDISVRGFAVVKNLATRKHSIN